MHLFLFSLFLWSCLLHGAAKVVMVTSFYNVTKLAAAQNVLRLRAPIIVYTTATLLPLLQEIRPPSRTSTVYIDRPFDEFVSSTLVPLLSKPSISESIVAIEKIFLVSNAIYGRYIKNVSCYAWVDIDAIQNSKWLKLFPGFPDSRKLGDSNTRLILTAIDNNDVKFTSIIVGGSSVWEIVRRAAVQVLLESRELVGNTISDVWWNMTGRTPLHINVEENESLGVDNVTKRRYFDEEQLLWHLLTIRAPVAFCYLRGSVVTFDDITLPAQLYGMYHFSYSTHLSISWNSYRCNI